MNQGASSLPALSRVPCLVETESTMVQEETEHECRPFFVDLSGLQDGEYNHLREIGLMHRETHDICLMFDRHYTYLSRAFGILSSSFVALDASRPWMIYWTLHSCDLLFRLPPPQSLLGIVHTLEACWETMELEFTPEEIEADPMLRQQEGATSGVEGGGFGGGPNQIAHCAPTYAAVLSLCIIATHESNDDDPLSTTPLAQRAALDLMERIRLPLYAWFRKLLLVRENDDNNGGYRMHFDGEIDVRATYTILVCASLLRFHTDFLSPPSALRFIQRCQTMEGGFGGEPWAEAHGGYTFCALAALQLILSRSRENLQQVIDLPALRGWLVRRQMSYEGGFQGRSNKLVDGCYSFWQGGAIALLSMSLSPTSDLDDPWLSPSAKPSPLLCHEGLLQRYILLCAQDVNGGFRDKPTIPAKTSQDCPYPSIVVTTNSVIPSKP